MLSRRRFLGVGGLGIMAAATGCQPPWLFASVPEAKDANRSLQAIARVKAFKNRVLGYPINMNTPAKAFFAWRDELLQVGIDGFAFNNVGNPFKASPIPYNTHDFEREIVLSFGKRFRFPEADTWGFLSHSGTDSNMHGMYMGRTLLQARTGRLPKAYFTREAHYSVQILRDLLGLEAVEVKTLPDGGMDPQDLDTKLCTHRDQPALVVATIGTTFKGAIDALDPLQAVLAGHPSYVHVDAALFGGYLPFTQHADEIAYSHPRRTNRPGRYDSIAVSCHKFFGFPSPAGLFITKQRLYDEFNEAFSKIHNPEYIHHVPGTITCSRDAVKPAEFYYFTTPPAQKRLVRDAGRMLENAAYLFDQLNSKFPELQAVRSNPLSNTVYFRHPGDEVVRKYSLATMHLDVDGQAVRYAHVVVMPHVSQTILDEFLSDLKEIGAG